jgi:hypothetical protein
MRKYTVVWTYIANYAVREVSAKDARDAVDRVTGHFSDDFQRKASVYAFVGSPTFAVVRQELRHGEAGDRIKDLTGV